MNLPDRFNKLKVLELTPRCVNGTWYSWYLQKRRSLGLGILVILNLKPQVRVSHLIFEEKKNLLNKDLNGVVSHGFL